MFEWVVKLKDEVSGPAGDALKSSTALDGALGELAAAAGPVGIALAALAAGAVAAGAVIYEGAKFALASAQAHEKLTASLTGLAGSAAGGEKALAAIRDLEKVLPQSEATLSEWTKTLMAAGVTDLSKLKDQITAISSAEALVAGGGEKVKTLLAGLAEAAAKGTRFRFTTKMLEGTGVTEDEFLKAIGMTPAAMQLAIKKGTLTGAQVGEALTKALKDKGAAGIAAQMNDLGTIWDKFKDSIAKLFEDVDVKPFIDALKDMLSVFDQSTATGKTFHAIITTAFNAIFKVAAAVLPYVKRFLIQLAIGAVKLWIAARPTVAEIQKLFSSKGDNSQIDWMNVMAEATLSVFHVMLWLVQGVLRVVHAFQAIAGVYDKAKGAGGSFVQGLIDGITGGASRVVAAVKGLAGSALSAFTSKMGINSPSTVMAEMGGHMTTGLAQGLENGAGAPRASMANLVSPSQVSSSSSSSSRSLTIGTIEINGVKDGAGAAAMVKAAIADLFEQLADTQAA